tara:strand:+ start:28 stop:210 length:183 start_codon:yes stop_codon:yes gene_type:complete
MVGDERLLLMFYNLLFLLIKIKYNSSFLGAVLGACLGAKITSSLLCNSSSVQNGAMIAIM